MQIQLSADDNTTVAKFRKAQDLLGQAFAILDELDTAAWLMEGTFRALALALENVELDMEKVSFTQYEPGEEEFETAGQ